MSESRMLIFANLFKEKSQQIVDWVKCVKTHIPLIKLQYDVKCFNTRYIYKSSLSEVQTLLEMLLIVKGFISQQQEEWLVSNLFATIPGLTWVAIPCIDNQTCHWDCSNLFVSLLHFVLCETSTLTVDFYKKYLYTLLEWRFKCADKELNLNCNIAKGNILSLQGAHFA